jgi:hypothetical protein
VEERDDDDEDPNDPDYDPEAPHSRNYGTRVDGPWVNFKKILIVKNIFFHFIFRFLALLFAQAKNGKGQRVEEANSDSFTSSDAIALAFGL